jgi:hypothetical protein
MDLPRVSYTLYELGRRWDKYGIGEIDIEQMAATGNAELCVWYEGTIRVKKSGVPSHSSYCGFARLPVEEAIKFSVDDGNSVKILIGNDGESFSLLQSQKEDNVYWREDLCMLPAEVKRLDVEFRLKSSHIPDETKADGKTINSKSEQTLLKIIGALLHLHYNRSPFIIDGKPNALRIEEDILSNLGKDSIKIDGLRDGTIRRKIPAAFKSIKEIFEP